MKVEIQQQQIKEGLYNELDYGLFLSLFEQNQVLLPSVILTPMTEQKAFSHYALLAKLEDYFEPEKISELLRKSSALPSLDHLLGFFKNGQLQQYHLFELGTFLQKDKFLCLEEKSFPLDSNARQSLDTILHILLQFTDDSFSALSSTPETSATSSSLAKTEIKFKAAVNLYEEKILEETGLHMTYPWPREIALSKEQAKQIADSGLLKIKWQHDICLIDYVESVELQLLKEKRATLNERFELLMHKRLAGLNEEIISFAKCFEHYYQDRLKRTWHYVLLAVKDRHNLCLPEFTDRRGCRIKQGYLHGMKARKQGKCIPLDLSLRKGAVIIYGANMSGKTTVLKTLYFLLTLVRFGLPLPAKEMVLHYPEQVSLMLKSSGDVRNSTSTYGEELTFFSQPMKDGAYILCDELFLSTDPANGALLSEILIKSLNRADVVFCCSTHYPEILNIDGTQLYRMEDPAPHLLKKSDNKLQALREFMPYKLMPISDSDHEKIRTNLTPLQTALLFDLPPDIKMGIKKQLALSKKS